MNLHEIKPLTLPIIWVRDDQSCGNGCTLDDTQDRTTEHDQCLTPILGPNRWCYCEPCHEQYEAEHYVALTNMDTTDYKMRCQPCAAGNHPRP